MQPELKRIEVPSGLTASDKISAWDAVFGAPGAYVVAPVPVLAKASPIGSEEQDEFEVWFLRVIEEKAREHFLSARNALWSALEDLLHERGVKAPSELAHQDLQRALFDLSSASTARMVGSPIPTDVAQRLTTLHFTPAETGDFFAIAYRAALIYEALTKAPAMPWLALVERASAVPLSSAERAAIEYARNRAGLWLQPIFDANANAWTAQREVEPLRRILAAGLERRTGTQGMVRQLEASQRAQSIARDARRTIRTELAWARSQGAWQVDSKGWDENTLLFRQTSAHPCKSCLLLYKNPDGTPRLWKPQGISTEYNRGPWREWRPTRGATHPGCVCSPWQRYLPAMALIFEQRAPEYAKLIRDLKLYDERTAAHDDRKA